MSVEPIILIVGDEELLVERAIGDVVASVRADDPEAEVIDLVPGGLEPGRISELTSPSLFGGGKVLVVRAAQDLGKDLTPRSSPTPSRPRTTWCSSPSTTAAPRARRWWTA